MSEVNYTPRDSELITVLQKRGPVSAEAAPRPPSNEEKARGVWKFSLSGSRHAKISGRTGRLSPVYYLKGVHSMADVLREFIDANELDEKLTEKEAEKFLSGANLDKKWSRVAQHVRPEYWAGE